MCENEQAVHDLIAAWMVATRNGDVESLLDLMSEDVVYLQPGQEPMRGREAFARGFQAAMERFAIEAHSDIQEIEVSGPLAYCWNHLTVKMIPRDGSEPKTRSGHVLTILRKEPDGQWRLFRDANLLG